MALSLPTPPLAEGHVGEFFRNIFTGAFDGDLLSIVVLAIVALIILRFIAARWVFVLVKQIMIFGGLGFAVWYGAFGDGGIGDRWGETAGQAFLVVGGAIVTVLFFIMLYMFAVRRKREKALVASGMHPDEARKIAFGKGAKSMEGKKGKKSTMRVGSGSLQGQGLPVHFQKSSPKAAGAGGGGGSTQGSGQHPEDLEVSRMEETLKRMNVLGATKEQNLLTVSVLILVAQFGVFTSRTVSAPNATVGMTLFGIFVVAAAVFVMTAYEDRMKGIIHFVYATIFALVLSGFLLVYWAQTFECGGYNNAELISDACANGADNAAVTWATVLQPRFYFASEGLIAMITGVAFSTLLTKGGG